MGHHSNKKKGEEDSSTVGGSAVPIPAYISPVAQPLLDGKVLERASKLLYKTATADTLMRQERKALAGEGKASNETKRACRMIRRGPSEVIKSIRKGEKGIVFMASDVYPIDIIAHVPVFCEDNDIAYAYLGSKRTLGCAIKTKQPASLVMVVKPTEGGDLDQLYAKVHAGIKQIHPYL